MNYREIRNESEAKRTILLNESGLFFAFNNEQFIEGIEKNKHHLKDGFKFVSIGAGGYLPKNNVDKFLDGLEAIRKAEKKAIKAEKDAKEAHILFELCNHEAFYTCSIEDAMRVLPYTPKQVWDVYNKHKEAYQANL